MKNGTIKMEEMGNPNLYEYNCKVRDVYHNDILALKRELETMDVDLETKARYAYTRRIEI